MFINNVFAFFQDKLCPIYNKSFFLQKIDWLIFANILLVILSSTVAPSDYIGYFAIFAIILTVVKLLTKQGEKFELTWADKLLLLYFIFVIIRIAKIVIVHCHTLKMIYHKEIDEGRKFYINKKVAFMKT